MSILTTLKQTIVAPAVDERQQTVLQSASWRAMLVLIVTYLIIGIVYATQNQVMPLSTQVLFLVSVLIFAFVIIRQDGYSFKIPGLPDDEFSLAQPPLVRAMPWFMFFFSPIGIIYTTVSNLAQAQQNWVLGQQPVDWGLAIVSCGLSLIFSLGVAFLFAAALRRGPRLWIDWITAIIAVSMIGAMHSMLMAIAWNSDLKASLLVNNAFSIGMNVIAVAILVGYRRYFIRHTNSDQHKKMATTTIIFDVILVLLVGLSLFGNAIDAIQQLQKTSLSDYWDIISILGLVILGIFPLIKSAKIRSD